MVRKAGIMETLASTLGTIETIMAETTKAVEILSSYNSNWQEERAISLAESRHERAVRWSKLGAAIRTQELNTSDVELAMKAYKGE